MNKTFGDLMSEYVGLRDQAQRFSSWEALNKFVESLVNEVAPKPEKAFTHKFQEYAYDDMGTPVPHEQTND